MPTVEQYVQALAEIESYDNPEAWGDYTYLPSGIVLVGQKTVRGKVPGSAHAVGRWQVHPDRLWGESHRLNVEPRLGESWDSFGMRVVTKLFSLYLPSWSAVYIAMYWHVGHWCTSAAPEYDAAYAVKYENALAKLVGAP